MTTDVTALSGIVVGALGGAAVGVERERTGHATGRYARFGGIRTFTLLGGVSSLAGSLVTGGMGELAVVLVAGAVALVIAGYVAASRRHVDATTEVAGLVVVAAGLLAGTGRLALASGTIAITALLLVEKSRLHALVARIDDAELRAAARFGVMAVVILPLLPEGPFASLGGIKPRELWLLVLFFTGLSFAGYLARRAFGPQHGYPVAGALAGLISSTSATWTFARLSRNERALSVPLAVGTIAACTMLFPRVLIATVVLHGAVAWKLLGYLTAPFAIGLIALLFSLRGRSHKAHATDRPTNPLQVGPALQMAGLFQVVLFVVGWAQHTYGNPGLLVSAVILGLGDVDALTISMATSGAAEVTPAVAAQAIAVGILANSLMKLSLGLVLGTPTFRRVGAVVLAAMAVAIGASIALLYVS